MDYIFFTTCLHKFTIRNIPKKSLIINLSDFDSPNQYLELISKSQIKNIIFENEKLLQKFQKLIPNHNLINLEKFDKLKFNISITKYIDKSLQNNIKYIILSSILTLIVYYNLPKIWTISILVTNFLLWYLIFSYFIDGDPWTNFFTKVTLQ